MKVLYEDKDLIVVIKPAGVQSQVSKGFGEDMVSLIKKHIVSENPGMKTEPYVGVIHRLDTMVEGIMVYAKTKEAAGALSAKVAEGKMGKHYLALLDGQPSESKGKLVDYLVKDEHENISRITTAKDKNGKKAELDYKTVAKKYTNGRRLARVEIDLITGRHHQIRVQFSSRKMPVIGDARYGTRSEDNRLYLASTFLSFTHPKTRKPMKYDYRPEGGMWEEI